MSISYKRDDGTNQFVHADTFLKQLNSIRIDINCQHSCLFLTCDMDGKWPHSTEHINNSFSISDQLCYSVVFLEEAWTEVSFCYINCKSTPIFDMNCLCVLLT